MVGVGGGTRTSRAGGVTKAARVHIHGPKSLLPRAVIVEVKNDQLNETWQELLTRIGATIPTKWEVFVHTHRRADLRDGWRATLKDQVKDLIDRYSSGNRVKPKTYTVRLTYSTGEKGRERGARKSATSSISSRIARASSIQVRASTGILGNLPRTEGVRAPQNGRESRVVTRGSSNRTRRGTNYSAPAVRAASIRRTARVRRNADSQQIAGAGSSRISNIAAAVGPGSQVTGITAPVGVRGRSAGSSGVGAPTVRGRNGMVSNNQMLRGNNVTLNSVSRASSVLVNASSTVDNRRTAGTSTSRILTPPQAPQSAGTTMIQPKVERDLDDGDNGVVQEGVHNENQAVVNSGIGVAVVGANVSRSEASQIEDVKTIAARRLGRFSLDFVTRARDEMKQLQRNYLWDRNVVNAPLVSYLLQEILK